ncbi:metallophosphoesterase [Planococcus maritimus]|uniref:Metallophosphoesterase n=1 Tax=Planococcus maritimus TaxID=192421 RepID=A0A7D7R9N6_PLAMR|nr:metallophosphoesterase [Planococcus maritimus]QMT17258.1 metallophosphoesterase [Planococcus maritimus]
MKTIRNIALILVGLLLAVVAYGFFEPYLLDVTEEQAVVPNLPQEWEGSEIAVLGDFQIGLWGDNADTIEEAVEEIVERDPVAVLMLGDFIYHPQNETQEKVSENIEVLKPLKDANIPMYTVMGNHDFGLKEKNSKPLNEAAERMRQALKELGVKVLHNESIMLTTDDSADDTSGLYLAGVGSNWMDEDDAAKALEGIPAEAARVVMMHNPNSFKKFPADSAPFAVAGHTHGGQIRLPGMPDWSWMDLTAEEEKHTDGWIEDYGAAGNQLYVNRGIGMSTVPIRIHAKPELTMFTLASKK